MTDRIYHFESATFGTITATKEELESLQDVLLCAQIHYYDRRDIEKAHNCEALAEFYDDKAMEMCRTYNRISELIGD